MKRIEYSREKDALVKKTHGVSFKKVQQAVRKGNLLAIVAHPNQERYPEQKLFVIEINHYVYVVPVVEDEYKIFLKTIYPSRKYTKKYLKRRVYEKKSNRFS